MDIHRCRFVNYPPSTINALAFSQSFIRRKQNASQVRLAIGRANGDIEIWNPLKGAWLQEIILRGGKDRSVDGLVWIQDPDEKYGAGKITLGRLRLFSIGYTTTVTEWDLEKGQPLRQSSGNHGEIWCLAAQPPLLEATVQKLVTGCTDGAVVLYSTEDEDLKLERVLVKPSAKRAKVISITFQDRNIVVAGCTDSTIRVYDIRNATLIRSISLGAGAQGGPREIIVWSVKCLRNGNIVSGDSTGEVRIWDGKTYTLTQRIKSHRQDVLSLATSNAGDTILSGGMDRRTVIYKQTDGSRGRWAKISHQRFHRHDVKTMATFEGNGMSIVASGGPDASPMIVPLRKFGMENQRMLPRLPQEPPIQSSPGKRLVMSWWDREINIWNVNVSSNKTAVVDDREDEDQNKYRSRKLVAKVLIKGEANITSVSISSDGSLLAVSTLAEVKLFELKSHPSKQGDFLKVSKIRTSRKFSTKGAKLVQFSPDGHWLGVVRNDNQIIVARVLLIGSQSTTSFKIHPLLSKLERINRKIEKHVLLGGLGIYDRTVTRMAFSSDSRILAVSDLAGYIDTWVLEGQHDLLEGDEASEEGSAGEDASSTSSSDDYDNDKDEKKPSVILGQHWIRNPSASLIPNLASAPVVMSFRPTKLRATVSTTVLHPTRSNPHPHTHVLPSGEDRLLVVTATTKVHEFEVLKGRLTEWSRANPTVRFPFEFQSLRDQAMGSLWNVEEEKERLWLYGSTWMWMFDLSRNFPDQTEKALINGHRPNELKLTNGHAETSANGPNGTQIGRKRKRERGTGAGSKVPDSKLSLGMSRKVHVVTLENEKFNWQETVLDQSLADSDVNMDESEGDDLVGHFQRGENEVSSLQNENGTSVVGHDDDAGPPVWWHSFKYRPIMGVVPLSVEGQQGLEVALVERPIWEADLPPRYYGQEWEKPGV